jgi:hypothetical protein
MRTSHVLKTLAITLLLTGSRTVLAKTVNVHASQCVYGTGAGVTIDNAGQLANTNTWTAFLWCPVDYDSSDPPTSVVVDGFSNGCTGTGSNTVYGLTAKVCAAHSSGGAQLCAAVANPGTCTAGVYPITASVPSLSSGDHLYVLVGVGQLIQTPPSTTSYATFFGYEVNSP